MGAPSFISRRIRLKSRLAAISMGVGMAAIVLSMAVSEGFRRSIRNALADVAADVSIRDSRYLFSSDDQPVRVDSSLISAIAAMKGVDSVETVIYRGGIVRGKDCVHGAIFKGIGQSGKVSIPQRLADLLELSEGDDFVCYFPGERLSVRKMKVDSIYEGLRTSDGLLTIFCDLSLLRRVALWEEYEASAIEVFFDAHTRGDKVCPEILADNIRFKTFAESSRNGRIPLSATDLSERYPQFFDWLTLIEGNVKLILLLMVIVAAFNMVTSLLISLFEHIGMIGLLKSMGMPNRGIAGIFLRSSARTILLAMLVGEGIALILCIVQDKFHLISLNPENYFISRVPVFIDPAQLLLCNAVVFVAVMAAALIPCAFISRIDPAKTLKAE